MYTRCPSNYLAKQTDRKTDRQTDTQTDATASSRANVSVFATVTALTSFFHINNLTTILCEPGSFWNIFDHKYPEPAVRDRRWAHV